MNHIEMMKRAEGIAKTSTCPSRQVGASVLLDNGQWSSIANDCEYNSTNNHHAKAIYYRDAQPEMEHLQQLRDAGVLVDSGWITGRVAESWAERNGVAK